MLNKLLKYDLQYNFKVVSVFYILSIFFAILTRIFLNIENSFIMNIIGKICSGVTISMIFNIIINNIMRLWARFRNNLYKDEVSILTIKKAYILITANKNHSSFFQIIDNLGDEYFVCDFIYQDYFWINDIKMLV